VSGPSVYVCEAHGQGVVVAYTYQDEMGASCPFCIADAVIGELRSQIDALVADLAQRERQ
jgi:hypothetical protein